MLFTRFLKFHIISSIVVFYLSVFILNSSGSFFDQGITSSNVSSFLSLSSMFASLFIK